MDFLTDLMLLFVIVAPVLLFAWFITSIVLFAASEKGTPRRILFKGMVIASSVFIGVAGCFAAIMIYFSMNPISFM